MKKLIVIPAAACLSITAAGCAQNYAAEGAIGGAVAGAVAGEVIDGDPVTGAAIGAAAGAAAGYFIDKNNRCDGYDSRGRLDDDCRGLRGYPD